MFTLATCSSDDDDSDRATAIASDVPDGVVLTASTHPVGGIIGALASAYPVTPYAGSRFA